MVHNLYFHTIKDPINPILCCYDYERVLPVKGDYIIIKDQGYEIQKRIIDMESKQIRYLIKEV